MDLTYYRVGPPDSTDLFKLNLKEILIEVCSGVVRKEIGINTEGEPVYKSPSSKNIRSFRGLFDTQFVNSLIGEEITKELFLRYWNIAAQYDADDRLNRKI
jgi:hypothetical protein